MPEMETYRLVIRRFKADDWQDLHEYLSQEAVVRFEPYPAYNEAACKQEAFKRSQSDSFWAVCLKGQPKLIGNLYFQRQEPPEFRTWELGYVFNPQYYGKGYATESCRRILDYGFQELQAYRIIAMCNPENVASWQLLERLGMRREGHLRKNIFFKYDPNGQPIWNDTYEYALLSEEWAHHSRD
ncbi:RimJ/RimL family protein N-acetyltransferase [Hydrogenispora ethanolica]|uniref:RimJ/RimL family protein N-acetyltransferase n=2 Tax=Hydrogenispora ethanolica TaxID=1082276 RepID=A0A4R1QX98_HYDET|nr:RimJ/RimL family protein N-acetyltransferase [Hydrogenispora ethanolica]